MIVAPVAARHSHTRSRKRSRPRSKRVVPSARSCFSITAWTAIEAWSVPQIQSVSRPCIRRRRISVSWIEPLSAWPMCSSPVMFGGGSAITYGSPPGSGRPAKTPVASQRAKMGCSCDARVVAGVHPPDRSGRSGVKFPAAAADLCGMTREHTFWHHYLLAHPGHAVLTFSTPAAVGALLCLFLIACWTTAQVDGPLRRVRARPGPVPVRPRARPPALIALRSCTRCSWGSGSASWSPCSSGRCRSS